MSDQYEQLESRMPGEEALPPPRKPRRIGSDVFDRMLIAMILVFTLFVLSKVPGAPRLFPFSLMLNTPHAMRMDPYPDKPRITYRKDKTFKLVVFSDLHYGEAEDLSWGPQQDVNSARVMRLTLEAEKPDFVVINGDLITGDDTFKENSTRYIDLLLQPLVEARIPFATTFGNHDNHVNISHAEEIARIQSVAPLAYTRPAPLLVGGQGGEGNYWVPVYPHPKASAPALILWFFDSRGGYSPGENSKALPDWVDESVAQWIKDETYHMNTCWGDADLVGRQAMVFVHIPPALMQGLQQRLNSEKEPGMNADHLGVGSVQSSLGTTNKDLAWWNAVVENVPNIRATVHGHDHGNEWCARDPESSIILCFNKRTGYGGYDGPGWGHGVRTFNFTLGSPSARTYIRYENGTTHADVVLDDEYDPKP